jgi:hypothetical protein
MQHVYVTPTRPRQLECVPPPPPRKFVTYGTSVRNTLPTRFIAFSLEEFDVHFDAPTLTAANELLILHTSTHAAAESQPLMLEEMATKTDMNALVLSKIKPYVVQNTPYKRSYKRRPKVLQKLRLSQQRIFRQLCKRAKSDMDAAVRDAYGYVPFCETNWTFYKK